MIILLLFLTCGIHLNKPKNFVTCTSITKYVGKIKESQIIWITHKICVTWMSLLQSTGSLTTNAAWTLLEKTSFLGTLSLNFAFCVTASLVVHFLYGASGSMFSKHEAYSSIERAYLKATINKKIMIRRWRWCQIAYSTFLWNIKQASYLKTLLKTIFCHHGSRFPLFPQQQWDCYQICVKWKIYEINIMQGSEKFMR